MILNKDLFSHISIDSDKIIYKTKVLPLVVSIIVKDEFIKNV